MMSSPSMPSFPIIRASSKRPTCEPGVSIRVAGFTNWICAAEPSSPSCQAWKWSFTWRPPPAWPAGWTDFELYASCNISATERLLAAVQKCATLRRFIDASTSSVYGLFSAGDETLPTRPISPYGVTKLAAEHLCQAHAQAFGLPLVLLRYFSVYGPRQRPDMGYYQFIRALLTGGAVTVFGDGMQVRGNTYIDDCVAATIAAVQAPVRRDLQPRRRRNRLGVGHTPQIAGHHGQNGAGGPAASAAR